MTQITKLRSRGNKFKIKFRNLKDNHSFSRTVKVFETTTINQLRSIKISIINHMSILRIFATAVETFRWHLCPLVSFLVTVFRVPLPNQIKLATISFAAVAETTTATTTNNRQQQLSKTTTTNNYRTATNDDNIRQRRPMSMNNEQWTMNNPQTTIN